jgi:ABC-type dipeptide/oligopeptide/nickel transport system ATPase component
MIQDAMARLRRGRTSFVIAHRLSTIRNADVIVVMDSGRVVEQGPHEELLRRPGLYRDLYNSQFSGTLAAPAGTLETPAGTLATPASSWFTRPPRSASSSEI